MASGEIKGRSEESTNYYSCLVAYYRTTLNIPDKNIQELF